MIKARSLALVAVLSVGFALSACSSGDGTGDGNSGTSAPAAPSGCSAELVASTISSFAGPYDLEQGSGAVVWPDEFSYDPGRQPTCWFSGAGPILDGTGESTNVFAYFLDLDTDELRSAIQAYSPSAGWEPISSDLNADDLMTAEWGYVVDEGEQTQHSDGLASFVAGDSRSVEAGSFAFDLSGSTTALVVWVTVSTY